ncbi:hypothetical protein HDU76_003943 [Blyttiomyces sp. JEL0837]|nr:hypothetical protein HDU76_003943 [Blyttiomyces sp. JEL0837]
MNKKENLAANIEVLSKMPESKAARMLALENMKAKMASLHAEIAKNLEAELEAAGARQTARVSEVVSGPVNAFTVKK